MHLETAARSNAHAIPLKQLQHEFINPLLQTCKSPCAHDELREAEAAERLSHLLHAECRPIRVAAAVMLGNMSATQFPLPEQVNDQLRDALFELHAPQDADRVFSTRETRDRESRQTA